MIVNDYASINHVALMIDISVNTIKRWYMWYENDKYEKPEGLVLPSYTYLDKRKTKFFKLSDIDALKQFNIDINTKYRGAMAQFNADTAWSKKSREKWYNNKGEKE